jgi:hypothetical protein
LSPAKNESQSTKKFQKKKAVKIFFLVRTLALKRVERVFEPVATHQQWHAVTVILRRAGERVEKKKVING